MGEFWWTPLCYLCVQTLQVRTDVLNTGSKRVNVQERWNNTWSWTNRKQQINAGACLLSRSQHRSHHPQLFVELLSTSSTSALSVCSPTAPAAVLILLYISAADWSECLMTALMLLSLRSEPFSAPAAKTNHLLSADSQSLERDGGNPPPLQKRKKKTKKKHNLHRNTWRTTLQTNNSNSKTKVINYGVSGECRANDKGK